MKFNFLTAILMSLLMLSSQATQAGPKEIRQQLKQAMPGLEIKAIRKSPIKGLYEIEVGMQIVYATDDGKHLVVGKIIKVKNKENLTEKRQQALLANMVNGLPEDLMIIIKPKKVKRTLTIFTDVDCPYCAKLHEEVPELVKAGVRIRYLLYPRNGPATPTFRKSVAVWCSKDRIKAIGMAKRGEKLEYRECDNPVMKNYSLGRHIGITGTPTIILEDGSMLGGYMPAKQILKRLGLSG